MITQDMSYCHKSKNRRIALQDSYKSSFPFTLHT